MNTILLFCLLGFCFFLTAGCSVFERHSDSGYAGTSTEKSRASSASGRDAISSPNTNNKKFNLKKMENSLRGQKELDQYSKALPNFKNDDERLEFLALEDYETRQEWLKEKNFLNRSKQIDTDMQELVDAQDIALGMPQGLVRKSWGEPDQIEVSGNPQLKNERWKYLKQVSTTNGYRSERKVVYFEGGRVVGWEVE